MQYTFHRRQSLRAVAAGFAGICGAGFAPVFAQPASTSKGRAPERTGLGIGGSTLAQRLVEAWLKRFASAQTYAGVGSGAAVTQLRNGSLDIAISDSPLTPQELEQMGAVQVPLCADALTVAINLPGIEQLKLPGSIVADMYSGSAQKWQRNDITSSNPGLSSALAVRPTGRADESGSTRAFTGYLSRASRQWQRGFGSGFLLDWPADVERVRGTSGMVQALRAKPGGIGYLGLAEARRANFLLPSLTNAGGSYVAPSTAAVQAALATAEWDTRNNQADIERNLSPSAWPLTVVVYALIRPQVASAEARAFLRSATSSGGADISALGLVDLPASARALVTRAVAALPAQASAA